MAGGAVGPFIGLSPNYNEPGKSQIQYVCKNIPGVRETESLNPY